MQKIIVRNKEHKQEKRLTIGRFCFFCARKIWQFFAITLVLIAVLISVLKYSLPHANDYKSHFEQLIFEKFNVELSIENISAGWEGKGPALELNGISFQSNSLSPIKLEIKQTRLHVNLWQTLLDGQFRSSYFVLDGLKANIDLPELINSSQQNDSDSSNNQLDLFEGLFLGEIGHFALENSAIEVIMRDRKHRTVELQNLTWHNKNEKHQGQGTIRLPGISESSLNLILDLYGTEFKNAFGELYLVANNLNITPWLSSTIAEQVTPIASNINFEAWSRIDKGMFKTIQLEWHQSELSWGFKNSNQKFAINSGALQFKPTSDGWRLNSSDIEMSSNQILWPKMNFELINSGNKYKGKLVNLDFKMLSQLFQLTDNESLIPLLSRSPKGLVSSLFINFNSDEQWQVSAKGKHFGWEQYQDVPGMEELELEINLNQSLGIVSLHSEKSKLFTGSLFPQDVAYEQLDFTAFLFKVNNKWQIKSEDLWLHNKDLSLAAEFKINLFDVPSMSLYAELKGPKAILAKQYYPNGYMPQGTIDYLNSAIIDGEIEQAQVLWHGSFEDYPYENNSGHFAVNAKIVDAQFKFQPDWPSITNLDVDLIFNRERMDIVSRSGKLENLSLHDGVTVSIDDLRISEWLDVIINTEVNAQILQPFFAKTPLSASIGEVLQVVEVEGDVVGLTHLRVNLSEPEVITSGRVVFNNLDVNITTPGIRLDNVAGELTFNDDVIRLPNIMGTWLDLPINLSISGEQTDKEYSLTAKAMANWNVENVLSKSSGLMQGYLAGSIPLSVDFKLGLPNTGFHYQAEITSSLESVSSLLPVPFNKEADKKKPFKGVVRGDEISNLITLNLDNQLYFNSIIENKTASMTNAHLIIGKSDLGLNASDFDVSIDLDKADMSAWIPFIDHLLENINEGESSNFFPSLKQIKGEISQVDFFGALFNQLDFKLDNFAQSTQLKIMAKELRAQVSIPKVLAQRPIYIETDYLRFNLPDKTKSEIEKEPIKNTQWLTSLPAIRFKCADCRVDDYQLDKVTINLDPIENGIQMSDFILDKDKHKFTAKGIWKNKKTDIKGHFTSKDIGELFDEYNFTSSIKDSKANAEFELNWQGLPYEFDVNTLSGDIKWSLAEGHLTEVSDGGARVFSLLSLDSLVRKLKLDFRDVFAKGFFYNSIKGDMHLNNGIASTKNTKVDGVPADVAINGYANLITQELNYNLSVSPEVTSSIPVIVAWMVNPVTGLAALAIDKVLHSAKVISEIKFKISGTMVEPVVTELGRKSREVEIPQTAKPTPELPESKLQLQ
ncbi:YhdP family protein [Pseudoalteromonas denitrificans]|uniref:TIGR02099 family protein n=1 Tax=Pseudoalteromonas denitrificans DSM 6059 TaxID=1123010 RepID=A0A1I1R705_9GAMM|nr:YhdP family protein [Pseudoalteromonas denitrificans]SFD30079.1 TIGR02099 family protein [Pseudoalteromonas denitrificans DSM 6059]